MLRVFAWLVSNVASMFGRISNRPTRDWYTDAANGHLFLASNNLMQETPTLLPSSSGKAAPGSPAVSTQVTTPASRAVHKQDAQHKDRSRLRYATFSTNTVPAE
jgi:hypothetical protein